MISAADTAHWLSSLREAGIAMCVWNAGCGEDPCHQAVLPGWTRITDREVILLIHGLATKDKWGRVTEVSE